MGSTEFSWHRCTVPWSLAYSESTLISPQGTSWAGRYIPAAHIYHVPTCMHISTSATHPGYVDQYGRTRAGSDSELLAE